MSESVRFAGDGDDRMASGYLLFWAGRPVRSLSPAPSLSFRHQRSGDAVISRADHWPRVVNRVAEVLEGAHGCDGLALEQERDPHNPQAEERDVIEA